MISVYLLNVFTVPKQKTEVWQKKPEPSPTLSVDSESSSLSPPRSWREGKVESRTPGQKSRGSGVTRVRCEDDILWAKTELEMLSPRFIFQCQEHTYDIVIAHLMRRYMWALWLPHMAALGMELPDPICFGETVSYLGKETWHRDVEDFSLIKWVKGSKWSLPRTGPWTKQSLTSSP